MNTKQIRNVDISGIQHLPMIDFIGNDFAIFDDIRDIPFTPYPTRLNAACLAVCRKGRCKMNINLQEYEMKEGVLCIILPEQIVQQGERSDDFSGSFIAVSRDFTADELQAFEEYHSFLWSKVKLKDNPYRKEITQGLLLALFYEIYDIYQGHTAKERTPKSRKEDLFERFIRYVSEHYKEERSVSYYADKMFLTPKHLSTVVKEVSGKTAGEWIDSLVILEAKAMLKSSEQSIQEIADELHFANQSFFGKYFKHHTGLSPKEYRKQ